MYIIDIAGRDLGGYVEWRSSRRKLQIKVAPGYAIAWSGQYVNLQHAKERMQWVIPLTLMLAVLLLYMHFRHLGKVLLVLFCFPFSLIGGFWLVYWLGYNLSVAVAVGFIALAGVAAEFGVVMLLYLDSAIEDFRRLPGASMIARTCTGNHSGSSDAYSPQNDDRFGDRGGLVAGYAQPRDRRRSHETDCRAVCRRNVDSAPAVINCDSRAVFAMAEAEPATVIFMFYSLGLKGRQRDCAFILTLAVDTF